MSHAAAATPDSSTSADLGQRRHERSLLSISFEDGQITLRDKPSGAPTMYKPSSSPSFSPTSSPSASNQGNNPALDGQSISPSVAHISSVLPSVNFAPSRDTSSERPSEGDLSIVPSFAFFAPQFLPSVRPTSSLSGAPSKVPVNPPTKSSFLTYPSTSPYHAPSTYGESSELPSFVITVVKGSAIPSTDPTTFSTNAITLHPSDEDSSLSPSDVLNNAPSPSNTLSKAPGLRSDNPTIKGDTTLQPSSSQIYESSHPSINQSIEIPTNNRAPTLPLVQFPSLEPTEYFGEESSSFSPTNIPSVIQSLDPTFITAIPSSETPTVIPSLSFTDHLSDLPTRDPSGIPSLLPTAFPSLYISYSPSSPPSPFPTEAFTSAPSLGSTAHPSNLPTRYFSEVPSLAPSDIPSSVQSDNPSASLSLGPTEFPTSRPNLVLTNNPSASLSLSPTEFPTSRPSLVSTNNLSASLSLSPTEYPTSRPSLVLTNEPSATESVEPSILPTSNLLFSISPTRDIVKFPPNSVNLNKSYSDQESDEAPWVEYLLITIFGLALGVTFGVIFTREYRRRNEDSRNKTDSGEIIRGFEVEVDSIFDDCSTMGGSREIFPSSFKKNVCKQIISNDSATSSYDEEEKEEQEEGEKTFSSHWNKLRIMTELDELDALNGAIHGELCRTDSLFDGLEDIMCTPKNNGEDNDEEGSYESSELLSSEGSNVWAQITSSSYSNVWAQITSSSLSLSMPEYDEQQLLEFIPQTSCKSPIVRIKEYKNSQLPQAADKTRSTVSQRSRKGLKGEPDPMYMDSSLV
eukprot:CAMPEP_0116019680 /NCGR_PEP_ID=MMETSP0321-20121206/9373_1 /TAXON_ID=163516 /ORGANISM="Leptocylindrus danicus var. danicus, Strain B650" /LENGTH=798 /DNA_ID=CAMNT_0003490281 /DNA_START=548 /DNA_END=2944 /DNA_ORIENTATION=-